MSHGLRQARDIPPQNAFRCLETKYGVQTSLRAENRKQGIPRNNLSANRSRARTIHITSLTLISGCRLSAFLQMKSTTYCGCLKKDVEKNRLMQEKRHSTRMENIVRRETAYFVILRKYYQVDEVRQMKWSVYEDSLQGGMRNGYKCLDGKSERKRTRVPGM